MTTQMAALDEFVTRARSQNDHHHSIRSKNLGDVSNDIQETFTSLGQNMGTTSTSLRTFATETSNQVSALQFALNPLTEGARQSLAELKSNILTANLKAREITA